MQQIEVLFNSTLSIGKNPFTVNVISFSGNGFHYNGDEIGIIPDKNNEGDFEVRFINFSGLARKFAA